MPNPNPGIDLTTLSKLINWLNPTTDYSEEEKQNMQGCITAASIEFLRRTGRGPQDGIVPTLSPFVAPVAYNEFYDGSGTLRQFVRNWPITSVSLVQVEMTAIPVSAGPGQYGYVIDGSGRSIALRGSAGGSRYGGAPATFASLGYRFGGRGFGFGFNQGIQNIQITYMAGFAFTPEDVDLCVRRMAAENYKSRAFITQKSQSMGNGAGSITYRDWTYPPACIETIEYYRRKAIV